MEIEKLIEKIAEEVYRKVAAEMGNTPGGFALGNSGNIGSSKNLAPFIDHTLLKPDATSDQIKKLCMEAREYKFASVCVNTCYVPLAAQMLAGSGVKTCCVVGFPLGAMTSRAKVEEAKEAIENGATEIDMVINIGAAKSGDWDYVKKDIAALVEAVRGKALLKVIIETCLLTDEEKVKACALAKMAGADFVKTSTGFSTGGATVEDVKLMRKVVGPDMGVKASGGVRDYKTAMEMINAGATRIGTSSGISIVKNETKAGANGSGCINCGRCSQNCPTGNVNIIKNNY